MSKHTDDAAFLVKWIILGAACCVIAWVVVQGLAANGYGK